MSKGLLDPCTPQYSTSFRVFKYLNIWILSYFSISLVRYLAILLLR